MVLSLNRSLKVLHISGSGDFLGGAELCLYELIKEECASDYRCALIVPYDGEFAKAVVELDVPVKVIKFKPWSKSTSDGILKLLIKLLIKLFINVAAEIRLFLFLLTVKPCAIHINTSAVSTGCFASKILNIPLIWHIRELLNWESGRTLYFPKVQRSLISTANSVIAVSKSAADTLHSCKRIINPIIVYDSIPVPDYRDRNIFRKGIPNIALIGSIFPAKGQYDAVRAISIVHARGYELTLLIAGDIKDSGYFDQLLSFIKENNISNYVKFLGQVDEPYAVLEDSDICLNCSMSESFGRVTVEGLLSGSLVVGRNTSGTAELLNNGNGLLFNTVDELASLLIDAIDHFEKSRKIAKAGQEFAWDRFSDSSLSCNKIMEVFDNAK